MNNEYEYQVLRSMYKVLGYDGLSKTLFLRMAELMRGELQIDDLIAPSK
jgi:hypothetical protein